MRWNEASREAVAAAYQRHARSAFAFAYVLTGSAEAAEDAVQDAFVAVASKPVLDRPPEVFAAYLRRAVINRVLQDVRAGDRRRRREHLVSGGVTEHVSGPDVDAHGDVMAALARLPARQRAAVVLRYYADLPEAVIGEYLRCRPGTVKSLLSRALDSLRKEAALDGYSN